MNATDLLKSQHRDVEDLFKKIEKAEGKGREQRSLFNELAKNIENHAKIEEKIFYPVGREVDEDITLEAYEEHDLVRVMIRKLKKTRTNDESFMARVTVLKELIEHHVKEEEEEYFPKCEKSLGDERLEEMGEELEFMFQRLMGEKQNITKMRTRKTSTEQSAAA